MKDTHWISKFTIAVLIVGFVGGWLGSPGAYAEHGKPTAQKVADRDFPSIFQAWNKAEAGPGVTGNEVHDTAMHDLYFTSTQGLGLQWNDASPTNSDGDGLGTGFTSTSIAAATAKVQALHAENPNLVILTEIRYWAAWETYLPADHAWWKRKSDGSKIPAWQGEGMTIYYMDWDNAAFREHVANQAKAAVDTGLVDGIMIDCMAIDEFGDADADPNRVDLIARIRSKIGDKLLLINSNQLKRPNMAPYINGLYMEVWQSSTPEHMQLVSDTLKWAEEKTRSPKINALELWYDSNRNDLYKMRAVTTLSLTHGNGYALFADHNENPNPDHLHNWYDFWNTDLGKPVAAGYQRADNELFQREFDKGTVIYNQKGNGTQTITFGQQRTRVSTGTTGTTFQVNDNDGDIFLYVGAPPNPLPGPAAAMQSDYYAASASSVQGNHNWYTQYTDGSAYTNMSWDNANNNLFRFSGQGISVFGEFGNNGGRIDLGGSYDAVLKWVAPAAGDIKIGASMRKEFGTDGDGVIVTVKKNNTVLWGPTLINGMTPTQLNLNQTVSAGDSILFIANKNNNLTGDQLRLRPFVKLYTGTTTPPPVTGNVALASKGATVTASTDNGVNFAASGAINGDRKGVNWGNGGGWSDGTSGAYPDWLQVNFGGNRTIEEIDVFTVQDNYAAPSEPTPTMTFSQYGITAFDVQYWNGSAWATIPGGSVTGNDKVWRKFSFAPVTTDKIRVVVNNALNGYSRITELEAWTEPSPPPSSGSSESMFASVTGPQSQGDWTDKELGIVFSSSVAGKVTELKAYVASAAEAGAHTARIWKNSDGSLVGGPYTLNFSSTIGWQTFDIPDLNLLANTAYTLSISTGSDSGRYYAMKTNSMSSAGNNGSHLSWQAHAGVYGTTLGNRPTTQALYDANYMRDIVFVAN